MRKILLQFFRCKKSSKIYNIKLVKKILVYNQFFDLKIYLLEKIKLNHLIPNVNSLI